MQSRPSVNLSLKPLLWTISSDEFRIWLKVIRNSTKNITSKFEFELEFGL